MTITSPIYYDNHRPHLLWPQIMKITGSFSMANIFLFTNVKHGECIDKSIYVYV